MYKKIDTYFFNSSCLRLLQQRQFYAFFVHIYHISYPIQCVILIISLFIKCNVINLVNAVTVVLYVDNNIGLADLYNDY